jgi:mannose-1-phosphate guanylyltransferase
MSNFDACNGFFTEGIMMNTAELDQQLHRCFSSAADGRGCDSRWAIVLAGGEGVNSWRQSKSSFRARRPLQYCRFANGPSPLQQTLDRATSIVPSGQVLTIIGRAHQKYLAEPNPRPLPGSFIEQPLNLGTAMGILLSATFVSERDPEANLIVLPSDHFVHPEALFLEHATQAFQFVEEHPDRLVLIGVPADRPETNYGWIVPQAAQDVSSSGMDAPPLLHVMQFREKPGYDEAVALLREDALWSTMVIVVKAKTLWAMARECLPEASAAFDTFRQKLRSAREGNVESRFEAHALSDLFEKLRPADFSKDILEHAHAQVSVMPMLSVTWCDWSRSRHLTDSLARLDRTDTD